MIDIGVSKVSKNYGYKSILKETSFEVIKGDKIAIVGRNGSGKSTLLKIIYNQEHPDSGVVHLRKNASIGYLSQIPKLYADETSVFDLLMECFSELQLIEKQMHQLEKQMAVERDTQKVEALLKRYDYIQQQFISKDGYQMDEKMERVIQVFQLDELLERPFNILSGGQKTIVELAILILKEPEILLLDEPTNHLDMKTLEWLENFLSRYLGTVIIVSHDRYFLDKVITKTLLLEEGKTLLFHGNYSFSIKEQERLLLLESENYKNQQKQMVAMKAAIKRFREWGTRGDDKRFFTKAKQLERRLEKMDVIDKPKLEKSKIPIQFENLQASHHMLSIENFSLGFNEVILFKNTNLSIYQKDKIALMGDNGCGKSTLIKSLLQEITNYQGIIKVAESAKIGYIPQEIRFDNDQQTVIEVFRKEYPCLEQDARQILAKYFFYADQVFKKVKTLSGGEKVFLKLAILLQNKVNFLILDEPTNHIDIETREMLETALLEYSGTILFVSHDRYFVEKIANKIAIIEGEQIHVFEGNYQHFKESSRLSL